MRDMCVGHVKTFVVFVLDDDHPTVVFFQDFSRIWGCSLVH